MQKFPRIDLHPIPDYESIKNNFVTELTNASLGKKASLSFIKHHFPDKPLIASGIVQGIVVGGTNYMFSLENVQTNGTRTIIKRTTDILPMLTSAKVFFDFLATHLDKRAEAIGFNFAFPLESTMGKHSELDGILLRGGKEHVLAGLIGKTIGKEVNNLFHLQFGRDIAVAVANDTICLMLAGDGSEDGSIIAGTGFNIGLRMPHSQHTVAVNLQASSFDKFEKSHVLKQIDAQSAKPGNALFEKIVSGKYLAQYFNIKARELGFIISPVQTSQELSELSHTNHSDNAGNLARAILEQSAFLVASALAAVYEFYGKPHSLTLIGEGSMLWDGWQYPQNLEKQLTAFGILPHTILFKKIQNSSINGAIGLLTK